MSQAIDERSDGLVLDVLVVGAGQAGLAAAYFLQQAGVRFRLFDPAARVGASLSLLTSMGPRFLRMIPPRVPPPRVRW